MKNCVLSAIGGALATLIVLIIAANRPRPQEKYAHIDFVSNITQEACFVCGKQNRYRGEDNVGIVNLNTFDLLRLEINCYDDHGSRTEEPAGFLSTGKLIDQERKTYAHAYCFPDSCYASVRLSGVQYAIDRERVQNHLCQNCLDSINGLHFGSSAPSEFAVVSFEEGTIRPLLCSCPWFSAGNFGVDCDFQNGGKIDLLIHYMGIKNK